MEGGIVWMCVCGGGGGLGILYFAAAHVTVCIFVVWDG